MKKFWLLLLVLLTAVVCYAQNPQVVRSVSATNSFTSDIGLNIAQSGSGYHKISFYPSGTVSTCSVTVDTSPDNVSWTAGAAIASQTCTSPGQFINTAQVIANFVRISATITGSGTVIFTYQGSINPWVLSSGTIVTFNAVAQPTVLNPSTSVGQALTASSQSALTTAVVIKGTPGNLYGFQVTNGAASICYLEFINAASAPTLGTATTYSFQVPASSTLNFPPGSFALSNYSTGISVGMATTYNGNTACGTAATAVIFLK